MGQFVGCTYSLFKVLRWVSKNDGALDVYGSKKLKDHKLKYATHRVKIVRDYLLGRPFKLRWHHTSLYYVFM